MSTLYGDHSTGFGPRDAVADRLAEVRAKQPRKHFAHTRNHWNTSLPDQRAIQRQR